MFSPVFYLAFTIIVIVGTCSELNSTAAGVTTERTPVSSATDLAELINCSFDVDLCNWNISVDDGGSNGTSPGWEIRKDEKGGFLWIAAAGKNTVQKVPKKAELRTPLINREENSQICLHFKYRLFGRGNGVDVVVRNSHRHSFMYHFTLRSTGNIWKQQDWTMSVYSGSYYIVLKAALSGNTGGIALDAVTVVEGICPDVKENIEQLSAHYHERRLVEDLTSCSELLKTLSSVRLVSAIAHASALKS